jgi:hypothetical protein
MKNTLFLAKITFGLLAWRHCARVKDGIAEEVTTSTAFWATTAAFTEYLI